ncbi:hypothetical protein AUK11_00390 [bacterium CG2_30_37_16]|nr:MAG: hypothetical protein AUK11_00390 [bacterium CG2_30_37_16]PIP30378.1 MAG: hypothetical protein COX25_04790 [bacterium (Candidatus Howlettbacteria) CG23_combo_of_CG06-09_8_20_14_all_37_9]PIX99407.1 MAG: hypothetical protein COZ22_02585 [bacterium (Candidatus Howlettbacteria) CG_4_10_14_3_um_filter_37_10]PJB05863.1 MAG: hypothetical protein CO123_03060 [bacterium (Candidatus Howlettbacteria) CG_4_9_14_3_um_filter_37_10]
MDLEQALNEVLFYIDDNIVDYKNNLRSNQRFKDELQKKFKSISKTSFFRQFRIKRLNKQIRDVESSTNKYANSIRY